MSPSHVLEPTYRRLKREIMGGRWPQDTRLEALRIADDYGVSATPVRDCLNRLTGEGLVVMRPGEGYRVPRVTEKSIRDMLELHKLLITNALQADALISPFREYVEGHSSYPETIAALFVNLAERSGNTAIVFAVRTLGERLHALRTLEPTLLEGTDEERRRLQESSEARSADLAALISAYHDRRLERTAVLVAALP
jgi:DNA-binding FadR family transcriptional regulator